MPPRTCEKRGTQHENESQGVMNESNLVHERYTLVAGLHEVILRNNNKFARKVIHRQEH